ncbi:lysophosphatidic acid receptor 6-like [Scyliorhinus canicula]|uniref:lysophosphatidic acid receptor 6-like n=1 Tax=Scyliorhinus canicula TaxID=7830 RepID=UPI0018F5F3E9|nr:lysophosphatidic acid receptor 6-like [Scyliorhinus canicula]XP_038642868.1 lysophosphatidic acid receptor 6-like [Scyliorhinus canicula]
MSNSTNNSESLTPCGKAVFTGLYSAIIVLGFFFNVVALWIFQHHIRLRSGTTVYMRNLAFADLLLVCFLPFRIADYYHLGNTWLCEVAVIIFLINMYTSIFFLTCISLDRCVATLLPLKVRIWQLHQVAPWVSGMVWLMTMSFSLPLYIKWKVQNPNGNNRTNCLQPLLLTKRVPLNITLSLGFGIPFLVLLTCSLLALVKVRKTCGSLVKDARKTQKMILANFLVFTFCFLPYHLLLSIYNTLIPERTGQQFFQATQLLASSNAVLDPLVYYFTTEAFKKTHLIRTVHNMLCCRCKTGEPVPTESCVERRETYKKTSSVELLA